MGATICNLKLEVMDTSALQVAHAICRYYGTMNSTRENALIDLEEVSKHINAYVEAERKALALKNGQ